MSVNRNAPLFLSDGTPVEFVKVTSRGRFQVRIPTSHPLGAEDPLRIFDPTSGAHYKGRTGGITLTNTAPTATTTAAPTGGRVDPNAPMFLTDGTPVTLSKVTRRGRIQVKLPDSHPAAAGQENGWLFEAATGARYKGRNPALVLTNTAPVAGSVDAAAVVSPVEATNATFSLSVGDSIVDEGFDTFEAAEDAAFALLDRDTRSVSILKVATTVVGVVGLTTTRA